VTEDFRRYACDVQQRVSGALESDNFRTQGQDGVEVDSLAALASRRSKQTASGIAHALERINSRRFLCFFSSSSDRLFITMWKKVGVVTWALVAFKPSNGFHTLSVSHEILARTRLAKGITTYFMAR